MQGMLHHRIVHESEAQTFAVTKGNGLFGFGIFLPVERPHIARHVAREVEFDFTLRFPLVGEGFKTFQVRVDQHSCTGIRQPNAGLIQALTRIFGDGLVPRTMMAGSMPDGRAARNHRMARFIRRGV